MFSVLTVLMFFGPLGVVAVGSRTEPRDLYITPLGSSNNCTFSDPCNLERAIQLFGEGFVGMDKILFEQGETFIIDGGSTLFDFQGVTMAAADEYLTVGVYDPTDQSEVDYELLDWAYLVWNTTVLNPPIVVADSDNVFLFNLRLWFDDVDASATDGIRLSNSRVGTPLQNIYLFYVEMNGNFQNSLRMVGPSPGASGFRWLYLWKCRFDNGINGVIIDGTTDINAPHQHEEFHFSDSFVTSTGASGVAGSGTCLRVMGVKEVDIFNSNFLWCGYYNDVFSSTRPNAIVLVYAKNARLGWNLITDMEEQVTAADGGNAIVIGASCSTGWIDHNLVQRVAHSAVVFESADISGSTPVLGEFNYTSNWYVSYNLFEMVGSQRNTVTLTVVSGCTTRCFGHIYFAQNTFYTNRTALLFSGPANSYHNTTVLNNVFYNPKCAVVTTGAVSFAASQLDTLIVGNVYVRNSDFFCPLVDVGASSYSSIETLRNAGFEKFGSSSYGAEFSANASTMSRIISLFGPSAEVNPILGDDAAGDRNPTGDRINGIAVAVDSNEVALDPVFNAPGHEWPIYDTDTIPSFLIEAYQFQRKNPVGTGKAIDLTLIFQDDAFAFFGAYDIMNRFVYDLTRQNIYDSGALRFVTEKDFTADQDFDEGQWNYVSWDVQPGVSITVQNAGNVTVDKAFDLVPNCTVSVEKGAILTIKEGNSTNSGTLNVGRNSTFRLASGQITMGLNSSFVVSDARSCNVSRVIFSESSRFVFGASSSRPVNFFNRSFFAGNLVLDLTQKPIIPQGRFARTTTTVQVAQFPAGTSTGTFTNVAVASNFVGAECVDTTASTTQTSTTLSVTLVSQNKPGCVGGTTAPAGAGGLSTGAIVGIAVGCAVGAALIVLLLLLARKKSMDKRKAAMNQQFRRKTVDEADRVKEEMQRQSNLEEENRRKRESLNVDQKKRESQIPQEGIMEL